METMILVHEHSKARKEVVLYKTKRLQSSHRLTRSEAFTCRKNQNRRPKCTHECCCASGGSVEGSTTRRTHVWRSGRSTPERYQHLRPQHSPGCEDSAGMSPRWRMGMIRGLCDSCRRRLLAGPSCGLPVCECLLQCSTSPQRFCLSSSPFNLTISASWLQLALVGRE